MGMSVNWALNLSPSFQTANIRLVWRFSRLISANELNVGGDIQLPFRPQDGLDLKDERREREDAVCLFIFVGGIAVCITGEGHTRLSVPVIIALPAPPPLE